MPEFKYNGFSYDLWVKPWKTGNAKRECLKWETGYKKSTWERISYEHFLDIKKKYLKEK